MDDPKTPPLSEADNVDVVGVREGGGIDLVISCSGPLDDTNETVDLLALKVRNYAQLATNPALFKHFEAKEGPVRIFVSCKHPVSPRAKHTLDSLRDEIAPRSVDLLLVKDMGNT